MIVESPHIKYRADFGSLLNYYEVRCTVEVGVDRGIFSKQILTQWRRGALYLVDSWESSPHFEWDRAVDVAATQLGLLPWLDRVRVFPVASKEAVECVCSRQRPGAVYIDASHAYKSVMKDIELWWPVLTPGGILAGHDFHENHPGVIQAVTELAERQRLQVFITFGDKVPSWYCFKPRDSVNPGN